MHPVVALMLARSIEEERHREARHREARHREARHHRMVEKRKPASRPNPRLSLVDIFRISRFEPSKG